MGENEVDAINRPLGVVRRDVETDREVIAERLKSGDVTGFSVR